jgi:hypothetical protein
MIRREKGRVVVAHVIPQTRRNYTRHISLIVCYCSLSRNTSISHTQYNPHPPALVTQHQAPILQQRFAPSNGRYCGIHQSRYRYRCYAGRAARLGLVLEREGNAIAGCILVGLKDGSLDAIRFHCPRGTACCRYAIAAKQCASMEGRPNAGPQTWSSSMA